MIKFDQSFLPVFLRFERVFFIQTPSQIHELFFQKLRVGCTKARLRFQETVNEKNVDYLAPN